jgi:anti-sigma factor (TIGR02949 family)
MHDCREIGKLLSDYLDGELDPETRSEMDEHLADCPPCLEFLDSFRSVVEASRSIHAEEMPHEMKDRLRRFLAAKITPRS